LPWSDVRDQEYVKRAAYALLPCLACHDRQATDEAFLELMPLIQAGAADGRNYVKKAVSWALRSIGKRNRALDERALAAAEELGRMDSRAARWISRDAIRDHISDATKRRLAKT
jgi:3-methyladenine DNA glycosylase AlkD